MHSAAPSNAAQPRSKSYAAPPAQQVAVEQVQRVRDRQRGHAAEHLPGMRLIACGRQDRPCMTAVRGGIMPCLPFDTCLDSICLGGNYAHMLWHSNTQPTGPIKPKLCEQG